MLAQFVLKKPSQVLSLPSPGRFSLPARCDFSLNDFRLAQVALPRRV